VNLDRHRVKCILAIVAAPFVAVVVVCSDLEWWAKGAYILGLLAVVGINSVDLLK
jgi:hypothetical protein